MALDAKQKQQLAAFKKTAKANSINAMCKALSMRRESIIAVLGDCARESTVLLALDRFAKAEEIG